MKQFLKRGSAILTAPQLSILSAASIIMVMIVISGVFGLIRRRVLLAYFVPEEYALLEAAFRFPDLFTAVFALGTLSSAFIPVFTKIHKTDHKRALDNAARLLNLGIAVFLGIFVLFTLLAEPLYKVAAAGFSDSEIATIASLARIIFLAQGFFVISYVLTGVLESLRRFLIPALAPIFYNIGIIIGTALFAPRFGLVGVTFGIVLGALVHALVQLPSAYRMGFRPRMIFGITDEIRKIGKLATPRMLELFILQIAKMFELFLASFISTASYAYFTLAVAVQSLPVGLIGTSIAKAALPTLTRLDDQPEKFKSTLLSTLYQVVFLVLPLSTILIVLRIPIVRLLFGTDIFDWPSTVQTGLVVSAFAIGIPFQSVGALLTRSFYAMDDTKTPVTLSLASTAVTIVVGYVLVLGFSFPTWALAISFSMGMIVQAIALFWVMSKRLNGGALFATKTYIKSLIAAATSGTVMFFLLKIFDRSVWVKRLSFLNGIDLTTSLNFERFVIDTRYTGNLIILSGITTVVGLLVYVLVSYLLGSRELMLMIKLVKTRKFEGLDEEIEPVSAGSVNTSET